MMQLLHNLLIVYIKLFSCCTSDGDISVCLTTSANARIVESLHNVALTPRHQILMLIIWILAEGNQYVSILELKNWTISGKIQY